MEKGMIGIRVKVQDGDSGMIESFGKIWDGVHAEQIKAWVELMREHTPGKELSELVFEALFLGMATMATNAQTVKKQESLRAAQIHEQGKRPEGYERARPVVKMIRTGDNDNSET